MTAALRRAGAAIVHHGGDGPALECLASLSASEGVELRLVLVDHNPRRSETLAARLGAVGGAYLWNPANPGFAAGANAGLERLRRDGGGGLAALVISNSDVTLAPDCLRRLIEALETDARLGLIGPEILCRDRPGRWWNLGSRIEWPAARPVSLRHGEPREAGGGGARETGGSMASETGGSMAREADGGGASETGFVCGCLLVVRPELHDGLGGLDESYFLYFEDADYSQRAQAAGWKTAVLPGAVAWHRGGAATQEAPALAAYCRTRSRLRFSRRWHPRPLLGRLHRLGFALRALLRPAWTALSPRRAEALAAARAAWDHLRSSSATCPPGCPGAGDGGGSAGEEAEVPHLG